MTRYGLTPQMRAALDFIVSYTGKHRVSPSQQDIADAIGVTAKSSVTRIIHSLKDRGYIDFAAYKSRSIVVLTTGESITLPVDTIARLYAFCKATGDKPADVVADAVTLHLDELSMESAA